MRGSKCGETGLRGWMATMAGLAALAMCGPAVAQPSAPDVPQASPSARVEQQVGVTKFSVAYSSPGVKGRAVWGALVPYGELWRSGANAATTLEASRDFSFGGTPVPAGSYAFYTIPDKTNWTVILNKNPGGLGTRGYDQKNDVARITVTPATIPARERLAYVFSNTTDDASRLDLEWDTLRVSVPLSVDTKAQVAANIDKALADAWRPHFIAARYLLDSGGDLNRALGDIDASIAITPTWWNNWVKAQILAKQGKKAEAVVSAEQAQQLGKGDEVFEGFFKDQVAKSIADWKKA
ncbi:MAG: DUF2911 domain-containing protein [bacterium]